jgi:hypothetical protein
MSYLEDAQKLPPAVKEEPLTAEQHEHLIQAGWQSAIGQTAYRYKKTHGNENLCLKDLHFPKVAFAIQLDAEAQDLPPTQVVPRHYLHNPSKPFDKVNG